MRKEAPMKRLIVFLLLLNFITTLVVGYTIYTDNAKKKPYVIQIESPTKGDDEKFKESMYKALGMLMSGQSQLAVNQGRLSTDILRVHHFVEPHADEFYDSCPECQSERQEILEEEKDNMAFNSGAE